MDSRNLSALVDQLDDNIDDLEEELAPLLSAAFSVTTKKLPVLDRAKLYVLVTYTIESLLFSFIRLHGQNAKEHPVFQELTRVRQYFQKIKEAETGGSAKRDNLSLDKEAVGRIIKHGLAGNEKFDRERVEKEVQQKAAAQKKLEQLAGGEAAKPSVPQKRSAETTEAEDVEEDSEDDADEAQEGENEASNLSASPSFQPEGKSQKRKKLSGEGKSPKKEKKHSKHRHRSAG